MNRAVWFDIPISDLDRAVTFYEAVLNLKIQRQDADGARIGVFEPQGGNSGCLVPDPEQISETAGVLIYLNVDSRIRDAVLKVGEHGGRVIQRIHSIEPYGYRAIVVDSEGNRIALHSTVDA